jgi:hypothetical protein
MSEKPGITDWIAHPLQSLFTSMVGGSETPAPTNTGPAAASNTGRSGIVGGFEHIAEDHPFLSALALAYADHKVNNRGILGTVATFFAAKSVLNGNDDGIIGTAKKLWLANEFKNVAEKAIPGNSFADTVGGWGTGILSFMEMSRIGNESLARHQPQLAPT